LKRKKRHIVPLSGKHVPAAVANDSTEQKQKKPKAKQPPTPKKKTQTKKKKKPPTTTPTKTDCQLYDRRAYSERSEKESSAGAETGQRQEWQVHRKGWKRNSSLGPRPRTKLDGKGDQNGRPLWVGAQKWGATNRVFPGNHLKRQCGNDSGGKAGNHQNTMGETQTLITSQNERKTSRRRNPCRQGRPGQGGPERGKGVHHQSNGSLRALAKSPTSMSLIARGSPPQGEKGGEGGEN